MKKVLNPAFLHSGAVLGISPGRFLIASGEPEWTDTPAAHGPSFYAPDFFLDSLKPWVRFENHAVVSSEDLLRSLQEFPRSCRELEWTEPSFEAFEERFKELQSRFHSGALQKGVPVVFETAQGELNSERIATILLRAVQATESLPVCVYGFWTVQEGIIGASPELLFSATNEDGQPVIQTVALAGTRRYSEEGRLPLLNDPKELKEHQLVIDGIAESLAPWGELKIGKTGVVELPHLEHLKTPIELRLTQPFDFARMVEALHPTPALGAFPRVAGWKWLREESRLQPRARFGAPFGAVWTNPESSLPRADCWVAIRNIQWQGANISLGSGCGVIRESQLEREWSELQGKRQAVKGILGL